MISRDTFDILTLIATWLAAIGTNAAVVVALWLAYRQNRSHVRVSASIVHMVEMGARAEESPRYFRLSAVNAGSRDVVVTGLQWTIGWIKKKYFVQLPNVDALNPRLPTKLVPGEAANYLFPMEMFERNLGPIAAAWNGGWFAQLRKTRIRVGVYLSTGESHLAKPDEAVLKLLKSAGPAT